MSTLIIVILWAIVVTCLIGIGLIGTYGLIRLALPLQRWLFGEHESDDA